MAVRVLIAAALIPDGDTTEVMHRVAGLLELLPWDGRGTRRAPRR